MSDQETIVHSAAVAPSVTRSHGKESVFERVYAHLQSITKAKLDWPAFSSTYCSMYYGIYLEPDFQGGMQPKWGLPPRFYLMFDLNWKMSVGGWFHYDLFERTDGHIVGDPSFAGDIKRQFVTAIFPNRDTPFPSFKPGSLLVAFSRDMSEDDARKRLDELVPDCEVTGSIWSIFLLVIRCEPFNESDTVGRLEDQDGIRYVEYNSHIHLISPGGYWSERRLL